MGCNCDCYCGFDTRSNRLKFLSAAVLFVSWLIIGSVLHAIGKECRDMFHGDCRKYAGSSVAWNMMAHHDDRTNGRHVPDECIEQWGNMMECGIDKQPTMIPFQLLHSMLFVAMIVPLAILCCCTKNPHKKEYVPIPAEAPLISRHPTGAPKSVQAPSMSL